MATETRFEFGHNWRAFLAHVDDRRLTTAMASLTTMLRKDDLRGKSFLDVGCGSGLFSLAAFRLGATRVHSFDYDAESVETTVELRDREQPSEHWTIETGDITNEAYCRRLGEFDVVYAWGVLHHTGALWRALENAVQLVAPGGQLFVAIYNDQGRASRRWLRLKHLYNRLPSIARTPYALAVSAPEIVRGVAGAACDRRLRAYAATWRRGYERGMSRWHDTVDWVGGYPFEVARPEDVFRFCRDRELELEELSTCAGSTGCNEFVFRRPN